MVACRLETRHDHWAILVDGASVADYEVRLSASAAVVLDGEHKVHELSLPKEAACDPEHAVVRRSKNRCRLTVSWPKITAPPLVTGSSIVGAAAESLEERYAKLKSGIAELNGKFDRMKDLYNEMNDLARIKLAGEPDQELKDLDDIVGKLDDEPRGEGYHLHRRRARRFAN